ncbi:MAG: flagellar hook-associated protein FlgK [Burkholderiales bacterium]|nr:flagellar hook-associated protein FlgK [Burkholderiales bacterium]
MGSGLLSIGTTAMFANQAKMDTVSHNISNANTAGYSRQDVELSTAGGRYTGVGYFGRGVKVATVDRSTDALLTREVNANTAVSAADQTRLDKLSQLEGAFPTGEAGLGYSAGQLLNAFTDVANQPQDLSARQVVLSKAEDLVNRMHTAANQVANLQSGVVSDINGTVAQINSMATNIAGLNQKIASVTGLGQPPNDLLDQRDLLIKKLAEKIQLTTVAADDGSLNVFIGGGQQLVLGSQTQTLAVAKDLFDPAKARVAIDNYGVLTTLDSTSISGGSLAGLLKVQDQDIGTAVNQLGQMASALSWRINQQQSFGLDLSTPPTNGGPMFDVGALQVLPSIKNTSSLITPPVSMTVVDARELQASDYSLAPDPSVPGTFKLTRLSDNKSWSVVNGDQIDGFKLNIGVVAPGDQFLLRPVGTSASNIKRVLDQPTGIAASSPVTATVNPSNNGTATAGALKIVASPATPYAVVNIVFTTASGGGENYDLRDASNALIGSGTWNPGSPIAYNGFELTLSGVPKDGDKITVAPTTYPSGNNGNALALLSLRDEDLVGRLNQGAGSTAPGATVTNAYSQVLGSLGVKVQDAKTSAEISAKMANSSAEMLSSKTGVNLDEEAARLIQFQQAYQAAAKILQVAQSVFDTLLSINR